ncbi:MAG TPA: porin [Paracoccaceae bacterium]|nr:porin [Paracoccaceae bacterium]
MMLLKRLAATTVACSLAGGALAAEPVTASIGGYLNIGIAYQNNDTPGAPSDEIGVLRDGEIHFKFEGTADNGLTFDGRVELEAFTTGDQIDENWARISSPWGSIKVGSDDDASDEFEFGIIEAPSTIIGYFDSDRSILESSNGDDTPTIFYETPTFLGGLAAMMSYAPQAGLDGATDTALAFGDEPKWAIGAGYERVYNGISFGLGGGYFDHENGPKAWQLGGMVGYRGASLGVHFDEDGTGTFSTLAVGVQYETGPWTVAGGWTTALDGPGLNNWGLWATYALAPGVTTTLGYEGNDDKSVAGFDTTVIGYMRIGF